MYCPLLPERITDPPLWRCRSAEGIFKPGEPMTVEVIGQNLSAEPLVNRAAGPGELTATSRNSIGR